MLNIALALSMFLALASPLPAKQNASTKPEVASSMPEKNFRDCDDCPEMVEIPAGSFLMGSPAGEAGRFEEEGPQRKVTIRQFAAGKFDVTKGQWAAFMSATKRSTGEGCEYSGFEKKDRARASWRNLGFSQENNHPVVCVTWVDAQDYVHWLSEKAGHKYRLMTEAEWEYAARAGSKTAYPWGTNATHQNANYGSDACCSGSASGRDQWINTSPVGAFPPNAFGLYDMHGNVLQWVQDCFKGSYAGLPVDGSAFETDVEFDMNDSSLQMTGMRSCSFRVLRGGDWGDPPAMIRSAFRNFAPPVGTTLDKYRSGGVGFRVARNLN